MEERKWMKQAIELAKKGSGWVNPNPLVGAVIVKNGKVIGQGYHKCYGQLHAEREAFASLIEDAKGATMYVTLEPCCHYGKQPPCTLAIIEHGIQKVVVGSRDPNPKVAGKGIQQLKEAGIEVIEDFMKEECDALNQPFFYSITNHRPYVVMKYAMTADGKIATKTQDSQWISNERSRLKVHQMRHQYMAIMVGIGTVLEDDPRLTCRVENGKNPIRVVCDSSMRIPLDCQLVQTAKEIPTYVAYCRENEKKERLEEKGVHLLKCGDEQVDIKELMKKLGELNIDSVLVEGGGTLNESCLPFVQEVHVFIGSKIFGGQAKSPIEGKGIEKVNQAMEFQLSRIEQLGNDVHLVYRKETSCLQEL